MDPVLNIMDQGFMQTNGETLELLQKAMSAGSGVDAGAFTGGRALSLESLDQTLVNILHTQQEAVLFQRLKKQPIKSVVHQWDARTDVGADDGAWVPEGGNSSDTDQIIARKFVTAKYLQTKRTVTLQAAMTNMIEDAQALEENAGTLWLIRNVEKILFTGNQSIVAEQPDGLDALIPSATHVIDLRGKTASSSDFEDAITEANRMVRDYFGRIDLLLSSTIVMQDMQKLLRDRLRFPVQGGAIADGSGGYAFNKYPTPFGTPDIKENVFIKEGNIPIASTLTTLRPALPVITSVTVTNTTNANSKFVDVDAGDYYYQVVAVNKYGDSVAAAATHDGSHTVTAGDYATIIIAAPADPTTVTGYKIYRSKVDGDGSDCRFMVEIAYSGSGATNFIDYNGDLPGCSRTYLLTTDPTYNAIEWAQFLPMMKFQLYPTAAAVYPFLMLLFGALAVKKPTQHVIIKNVAPDRLGWF